MASKSTGGWSAKLRVVNLPLVVALQALAFCLLAFLLGTPPPHQGTEQAAAGGGRPERARPSPWIAESQVPADLHPEQLRLPRFPDPKERIIRREPAPPDNGSESASGVASALNALRMDTVPYQTPTLVQVALALPDAPDHLAPGMISARRFGDGLGSSGRRGRRGWGGIEGIGIGDLGDGPRCHPRRPGFLRDPRNPISDPPTVINHLR